MLQPETKIQPCRNIRGIQFQQNTFIKEYAIELVIE